MANLETSLQNYEPSEEPFDNSSVSRESRSRPFDTYEKLLLSIPEFSTFGKLFKSSAPVELTKVKTKHAVNVVKHIFDKHVVFQYNCTNTVPEQLLEDVTITVDASEAEEFEELATKPIKSLPYGTPGNTFVGFEKPEGAPAVGKFTNVMHLLVKEVDRSTGEAEEDGVEDEYQLEKFEVVAADYVLKFGVSNFSEAWEKSGVDHECVHEYDLGPRESLKEAVSSVIGLLGMQPCEGTEVVAANSSSHTCLLSGVYIGNLMVLARLLFTVDSSKEVAMKLAVRSNNIAALDCYLGTLREFSLVNTIKGSSMESVDTQRNKLFHRFEWLLGSRSFKEKIQSLLKKTVSRYSIHSFLKGGRRKFLVFWDFMDMELPTEIPTQTLYNLLKEAIRRDLNNDCDVENLEINVFGPVSYIGHRKKEFEKMRIRVFDTSLKSCATAKLMLNVMHTRGRQNEGATLILISSKESIMSVLNSLNKFKHRIVLVVPMDTLINRSFYASDRMIWGFTNLLNGRTTLNKDIKLLKHHFEVVADEEQLEEEKEEDIGRLKKLMHVRHRLRQLLESVDRKDNLPRGQGFMRLEELLHQYHDIFDEELDFKFLGKEYKLRSFLESELKDVLMVTEETIGMSTRALVRLLPTN